MAHAIGQTLQPHAPERGQDMHDLQISEAEARSNSTVWHREFRSQGRGLKQPGPPLALHKQMRHGTSLLFLTVLVIPPQAADL